MSPLIDALSDWRGRQYVQAALEERGFLTPSEWQRKVIEYCGVSSSGAINRYWDEMAREYVCSAGMTNSKTRAFRGDTSYRSEYLDGLTGAVDYAEPPFREPDLLRCVYNFEKRVYYDKPYALGITDEVEVGKQREVQKLHVSEAGWTGQKIDVEKLLHKYAESLGFISNGRRFVKASKSGLVFQCWVDTGGALIAE